MEKFAEWFYDNMNPWSSEDHLTLAAVTAVVLIFVSTAAILVLAYAGHHRQKSSERIYFAVAYGCAPLLSLAMSLLFKWYVSAAILTLIFAAVFLTHKEDKEGFATKKNFAFFCLANVILPNLLMIVLSLSGLPYKLL